MKRFTAGLGSWLILWLSVELASAQLFVHPGGLHVQADFDRMAGKVAAGAHPWIDSYNYLTTYSQAQTNWSWAPVPTIYRCGSGCANNFSRSQQDALAIYYNALRYRITGDVNFATHAIQGMDAWSSTCTNVSGDSNFALGAGLCGYEFACAGEELRGYSGWSSASQSAYSNFLYNVFYTANHYFLTQHNGTCGTHYRCNWDCCNIASMIAVGVFCDNQAVFHEAVAYYTNGIGNGNIERAVLFVHPDGLGQCEESGRDQAHCIDGVNSLSVFCQVAWNQGVDLFSYDNNRYLRALEYVAKYNLFNNVPYVHHRDCDMTYDEAVVSGATQGAIQYFWEIPYAHYVNQMGLAAPYTAQMAAALRPDSGISNWNSPDWFGFTSLTFYRDPVATGAVPTGLAASVSGRQITLSWWGSAYAASYNVKRATVSGGPYTTLAVTGPNNTSYVAPGLTLGQTYYYVVSANNPGGESPASSELAVAPNDLVTGSIIGSIGSYNNAGATIANVYDGSFESFYDASNASGDWAGLDLGAGMSSIITKVEYAPRSGFAGRMVGGVFQGANDPNFSTPTTLYTISSTPIDAVVTAQNGVLTSATVSNPTPFRYLRYLGPANGSCNVSEVRFHGNISGLTPPAAPGGLSFEWTGSAQLSISWTGSPTATSYNLKRSSASGGPYLIAANTTDTNVNDILPAGTTNCFYVLSAVNAAGESANSPETIITPPPPIGLAAIPGDGQVALQWTAPLYADSYNVKRATVSGGPYTSVATGVMTTNYLDSGLGNGTTYYYVVAAVNAGGEGSISAEASATPVPQQLVWSGSNNTNWDLSTPGNWLTGGSAMVYADTYRVLFDDTANGSTLVNVAVPVAPQAMLVSNVAKAYTFTGAIIGGSGSLHKSGSGTLTLGSANSYSGGTTLAAGTLLAPNSNSLGVGLLTLAGGTWLFTNNVTITNSIFVQTNTTTAINEATYGVSMTLSGNLSGGGNLTTVASANYGGLKLAGNNSAFRGTLTVNYNNANRFRFSSPGAGSSNALWVLNNSATDGNSPEFGSGTLYLGALSGGGYMRNDSAGTTTLEVGALNQDSTFSGQLKANGGNILALTKVGTGTLTLSGANNYTGLTTVKQGRLLINQALTGNGGFVVNNGATLGLANNFSANPASLGALTLAAGATLEFQNVSNLTSALAATSTVTVNGPSILQVTGTNYLVIGNTYPLLTFSGTFSGYTNLAVQMPPGFGGVLASNANQLSLSVTPPVPTAPSGLAATPGDGQASLFWIAATNATGYNLKRSLSSSGPYSTVAANLAGLACTNSGLSNGTLYFFVVSATNSASGLESANSSNVSVRPTSSTPTSLVFNASAAQLQLNWAADHIGWNLEMQTNAPGFGLGTNWITVPGSTATNLFSISISPTNGSIFFRLVHP